MNGNPGKKRRKKGAGGFPLPWLTSHHHNVSASRFFLPLHVIEYPFPDDEHPRDDHEGEQSCAEERGDKDFIVHFHHLTRRL